MAEDLLPCIEVEPETQADAAVLWLHGLGASGHDFAGVTPHLGLPRGHAVRFLFPHAPRIPVTLNMGLIMPAWYDITSLDGRGQDERGIRRSMRRLGVLVEQQMEGGIDPRRIVVGGFSQGGAIALAAGLRYPRRLAGVMGLSTYLLLGQELAEEASAVNRETPIFLAHGSWDPMVPPNLAERSRDRLQELGWDVEWYRYPIAHEVCLQEIEAVGSWLSRVLALT
jgi:phospholipase/carboxylesterase